MAYLIVTGLLYTTLGCAGRILALLSLVFGLAGCSISAANLVSLMAPVIILHSTGAAVFTPLVQTFLRLHGLGHELSIFFFSVQVAAWGRLILSSRILPRMLGALFLVEAFCNLIVYGDDFFGLGLISNLDSWILLPGLFAELGTTLWLLAFGLDLARWEAAART